MTRFYFTIQDVSQAAVLRRLDVINFSSFGVTNCTTAHMEKQNKTKKKQQQTPPPPPLPFGRRGVFGPNSKKRPSQRTEGKNEGRGGLRRLVCLVSVGQATDQL